MRLHVKHQTVYRYEKPVAYTIQTLRLSPRPHEGLVVLNWRVQADGQRELPSFADGFGNIVHCCSVNRPHDCVALAVEGEVETTDTAGIVRGGAEPLPPAFYLRSTPLTQIDPALRSLAEEVGRCRSTLERLHALMIAVRERVDYKLGVTDTTTSAAGALVRGVGVCQDHTHIFLAAARHLGIPARYVGGYVWTGTETQEYGASHAWAEAYVEDLGWVGFDAANRICPTAAYIRASVGLDYTSAMPVRGVRRGNTAENLAVRVAVTAKEMNQ
jgi:transglutaminase-like putative cysteine protease